MGSGGPRVGSLLIISGIVTAAIGAVLTIALGAVWPLIIVGIGISDLAIGALFKSGMIGRAATAESEAAEPVVEHATDDGYGFKAVENPYARED